MKNLIYLQKRTLLTLVAVVTFSTSVFSQVSVAISSTEPDPTNNSPFQVTIEFSEAVTGFVISDISVTNGNASNFNDVFNPTFTVDISPVSDGEVTVFVPANVCVDQATETLDNLASNTFSISYDITPPVLSPVTIASNNPNPEFAKVGDEVTVTFTASEPIEPPSVSILSQTAFVVSGGETDQWVATYTTSAGDVEGEITFTINYMDLAGNLGVQVNETTDASSVTFDKTPPSGYTASFDQALIDQNNEFSCSFTIYTAEAGATYDYTITSSGGGVPVSNWGQVTLENHTVSGIDVSGLPDGDLTLSVSLTDMAGNVGISVQDIVTKNTQGGGVPIATPPAFGDGSVGSPYEIATLENLYWISASDADVPAPNQAARWAAHYIQTAHIDASETSGWNSGEGFSPIGNQTTSFTGTYDGGGFVISNLNIDRYVDYQGLFGYASQATISNLGLVDAMVYGANNTGGLVGYLDNSTISQTFATANVMGNMYAGVLVGYSTNASLIENCYSGGNVEGYYVGGLIGQAVNITVTNCYSNAYVFLMSKSGGGLIGYNDATTVNNSFWDTETSMQPTSQGGTGLTTAEMRTLSTFTAASWDFMNESTNGMEDIWGINGAENNGYPFLAWQGFLHDESEFVFDIDGNAYPTVVIGDQTWMAKNLRVGRYQNGMQITTDLDNSAWSAATDGAYAVYPHTAISGLNSEDEVLDAYGALYNWYAVADPQGLCPEGWLVPTDEDWSTLINFIDPTSDPVNFIESASAASSLKSTRTDSENHPRWDAPNTDATDVFGFSALPGGQRYDDFNFYDVGGFGFWWSVTVADATNSYGRSMSFENGNIQRDNYLQNDGFSVRCIKEVIFSGGSGTEMDPYKISTLADLDSLSSQSKYWDKHFIQIADIAFSPTDFEVGGDFYNEGEGWLPIGNWDTQFTGTYDGGGHKIDGLAIDRSGSSSQGFFGEANGATIVNLGLINVNISGQYNVGALLGNLANGQVENCFSTGTVSGTGDVGGLVGHASMSNIEKCFSHCNATGQEGSAGGLIGWGSKTTIMNCYSALATINSANSAGGLAGNIEAETGMEEVEHYVINCYSASQVNGSGQELGGLIGGWAENKNEIAKYSFWDIDVSGQSTSLGGIGKTTAEMTSFPIYIQSGWDFKGWGAQGIWNIGNDRNNGYPYLDWQYPEDQGQPEQDIAPGVETHSVGNISISSATAFGEILFQGSPDLTQHGVCWNETGLPTIDNNKTEEGAVTETGEFITQLTGLTPDTKYFVRAYATNDAGTSYGNEITFITLGTVQDIEGNTYTTVTIGSQMWMTENLRATQYRNGNLITTGLNDSQWQDAIEGAYAIYPHAGVDGIDNETQMVEAYGLLYNWYAVADPRGLCPDGWHVPTQGDWNDLTIFIFDQGFFSTGNVLKSCRQDGSPLGGNCNTSEHPRWNYYEADPVVYGTDNFGFAAVPAGTRISTGIYESIGTFAYFWSTYTQDENNAFSHYLEHDSDELTSWNYLNSTGMSVRCVKDKYSGGLGTVEEPYLISSLDDLKFLSETPSDWEKHFEQTTDLAFLPQDFEPGGSFYNDGEGFMPIGNSIYSFSGSYKGGGHTIDGLYINRLSSYPQGLFGAVNFCNINSLGVTNANITGNDEVGVLVGYSQYSNIDNCFSSGSVNGQYYVGGLVGNNYESSISDCYSAAHVFGVSQVGGLIGDIGYMSTLSNSYSVGRVTGSGEFYGGLMGYDSGSTQTFAYSYWDMESSGQPTSAGGSDVIGKLTAEMLVQGTFDGWSFPGTWQINEGVTYPYLSWQGEPADHNIPKGTETNPYEISTLADLKWLSENELLWDKYFEQTADLALMESDFQESGDFYNGGQGFISIGNDVTSFNGHYNGNGHTIDGIFMNYGTGYDIGPFGNMGAAGTISNLGITNADINGYLGVAALVGNNSGTITGCFATGTVTAQEQVAGGVAGYNYGTISNSYSHVTVTRMIGSLTSFGSFVGESTNGTIEYCYSTGRVIYDNAADPTDKGFVGSEGSTNTYLNNFFDSEISLQTIGTGATAKTSAEMQNISTYTGWDFETTWGINPSNNSGYPFLLWQQFPELGPSITDIRNFQQYPIVQIGEQLWLQKNLRENKYLNNDLIPTDLDNTQWIETTEGAFAIFPHADIEGLSTDAEVLEAYGALYNWYAVTDTRGLCPVGWHVPTDTEWTILENNVGASLAGGNLKSTFTAPDDAHPRWNSPNAGATDEYGFSALPGGGRFDDGAFNLIGEYGRWWSSTESSGSAWLRGMNFNYSQIDRSATDLRTGYSIRCIRDEDMFHPFGYLIISDEAFSTIKADGIVFTESDESQTFYLVNQGSEIVEIGNFSVSLTEFSVSTPPTSIAPGESISFTISFSSAVAGVFEDFFTIESSDPHQPLIQVPLFAGVKSMPIVIARNVLNITSNSATSGGEVVDDGGAEVTTRGVVWSTTQEPQLIVNQEGFTQDGGGIGEFTSELTGLLPSTTYYVRTYATNSEGTAYGEQRSFVTLETATQHVLSITISGGGSVEVDGTAYTEPINAAGGAELALHAIASEGWIFDGWTGDLVSAAASEIIIMDNNKVISANFIPIANSICVTNGANDGEGSLRWAIDFANQSIEPLSICFDMEFGDTVFLEEEITISNTTTINGVNLFNDNHIVVQVNEPGISGWRVFNIIAPGETIDISNMWIMGGNLLSSQNSGGGIIVAENSTVNLNNVHVSGSKAFKGGAMFTQGTVNLTGCTINGNHAQVFGGGIYNHGNLSLYNTAVTNNSLNAGNPGKGIFSNGGALLVDGSQITDNSWGSKQPEGYDISVAYGEVEIFSSAIGSLHLGALADGEQTKISPARMKQGFEGYDIVLMLDNSNIDHLWAFDDAPEGKSTRSGFAIGGLTEVGKANGGSIESMMVEHDVDMITLDINAGEIIVDYGTLGLQETNVTLTTSEKRPGRVTVHMGTLQAETSSIHGQTKFFDHFDLDVTYGTVELSNSSVGAMHLGAAISEGTKAHSRNYQPKVGYEDYDIVLLLDNASIDYLWAYDDTPEGKSTRSGFAIGGLTEVGKGEGGLIDNFDVLHEVDFLDVNITVNQGVHIHGARVRLEGSSLLGDETKIDETFQLDMIFGLVELVNSHVGRIHMGAPEPLKNKSRTSTFQPKAGYEEYDIVLLLDDSSVDYLWVYDDAPEGKSTRSGFAIGGLTEVGKESKRKPCSIGSLDVEHDVDINDIIIRTTDGMLVYKGNVSAKNSAVGKPNKEDSGFDLSVVLGTVELTGSEVERIHLGAPEPVDAKSSTRQYQPKAGFEEYDIVLLLDDASIDYLWAYDDAPEGKSTRSGFAIGGLTEVGKESKRKPCSIGSLDVEHDVDINDIIIRTTDGMLVYKGNVSAKNSAVGKPNKEDSGFDLSVVMGTVELTGSEVERIHLGAPEPVDAKSSIRQYQPKAGFEEYDIVLLLTDAGVDYLWAYDDTSSSKSTRSGFAIGGLTDVGKGESNTIEQFLVQHEVDMDLISEGFVGEVWQVVNADLNINSSNSKANLSINTSTLKLEGGNLVANVGESTKGNIDIKTNKVQMVRSSKSGTIKPSHLSMGGGIALSRLDATLTESFIQVGNSCAITLRGNSSVNAGESLAFDMEDGSSLIVEGEEVEIVGSVKVQGLYAEQVGYVSAPIANVTIPADEAAFETWSESSSSWQPNADAAFTQMKGYRATFEDQFYLLEFLGNLPPASQSIGLTNSDLSDPNHSGWNMVGNPFTSALDFEVIATKLDGIENVIYTYDPITRNYRVYQQGGLSLNNGSQLLPVARAFFIKASQTNATFGFGTGKTHDVPGLLNLKKAEGKSVDDHVVITVTSEDEAFSDQTLVGSLEDASDVYTPNRDAVKLFAPDAPQLYTLKNSDEGTNDVAVAINIIDIPKTGIKSVPLNFRADQQEQFTITAASGHSKKFLTAMLEDLETGDITQLTDGGSYVFTNSGTEARFLLLFEYRYAVFFSVADGFGTLTAKVDGEEIDSGDKISGAKDVVFEASPSYGYAIRSWTVNGVELDDFTESILEVNGIDENLNVTVEFLDVMHTLTVAAEGEGTTVPAPGEHEYMDGSDVVLYASPSQGYEFEKWVLGEEELLDRAVTFTIVSDTTATAYFVETEETQYTLTMTVVGEGNTTPPAGDHYYNEGSVVMLYAVPSDGWEFEKWVIAGDDVLDNPIQTTIEDDVEVVAHFKEIPKYTLTLTIVGDGSVEVNGEAYTEAMEFYEDETVVLTAVPSPDWQFDGWSGDLESTATSAVITMDSNKDIIATFTEIPPEQYTLTLTVVGQGVVEVDGVDYTGPVTVDEGTALSLKAIADEGWEFYEWSGDLDSSEPEENVVMDTNKAITVTFTEVSSAESNVFAHLKVYPNPFSHSITLDNAQGVSKVIITNLIGQKVIEIQLGGAERETIQTDGLVRGVYLISLQAENGQRMVKRMIKE